MITKLGAIYRINDEVYGYTKENFVVGATHVSVYIPSLMSSVKDLKINSNKLVANDSGCKVPVGGSVTVKDYITAYIENNINWEPKVIPGNIVPAGTRVIVKFIDGNPQDPVLTNWK